MRLLIVDDGHYVVEYMKHLLDWKSFGIQQIETTTNSIEAREWLNQRQVDILITDIRMPEVSGIDLLQHIHQHNLLTKVIILSGYSQFEYAQQGIRLGALDYLLKPVDKDDVEKAMNKAIHNIKNTTPRPAVHWENFDGLGYLLSLLGENKTLRTEFEAYTDLLGSRLFCCLKMDNCTQADIEDLQHKLGDQWTCLVWSSGTQLVGLVPEEVAEMLITKPGCLVLSPPFSITDRNEFRQLFYEFFLGEYVQSGDFSGILNLSPSCGDWESAGNIMKSYDRIQLRKEKILFLMETILYVYTVDKERNPSETADWIFNRLRDPDELWPTLMDIVSQIRNNKQMSIQTIVGKVQKYIEDHLSHGLSLDELGKVAHLHPVYLSKLFKQETGENVSNYISKKRLERASHLLLDSELRIADISQMVGYKKNQYFIQLFKEEFGVTPYQYRRNMVHQ
ncbi:response regulator transcription factor [Paenibacillus illinoisensis]|uniref:AraC family transcriptional regulator n=1 Tax=Paenibacillus illinoisensis TaxID=59845 RepID=A0A2W0C5M2_9BACL|nr:response regulator [Paenibacillus illinoisensis]PYY25342.1 AraC family transcriptional regulator [Paenibacillus illinoisensis]